MSTANPRTEQRHEEPFVRQFSVFLPNRVGQLGELLDTLDEAKADVVGISVVDSTDWAVVRMVFSEPGKAREVLTKHGTAFTECEVIAALISREQPLHQLCEALVAAEINVQFAYPLTIQRNNCPAIILHVDDTVLARDVLQKHGFTLLDHEDV